MPDRDYSSLATLALFTVCGLAVAVGLLAWLMLVVTLRSRPVAVSLRPLGILRIKRREFVSTGDRAGRLPYWRLGRYYLFWQRE